MLPVAYCSTDAIYCNILQRKRKKIFGPFHRKNFLPCFHEGPVIEDPDI